jgi:hypothetical protein
MFPREDANGSVVAIPAFFVLANPEEPKCFGCNTG